MHACDQNGDWLPVRVKSEVLDGKEAIARLIENRLKWLKGEWWENPEQGLNVFEIFRDERVSEGRLTGSINEITRYIAETPGVISVEDVEGKIEGKQIRYTCQAVTNDGIVNVEYEG